MNDFSMVGIAAIVVGVIALAFAGLKYTSITKKDEGNERMREISKYIQEGAMTYLTRQYKSLLIFVVAVAILLAVFISLYMAICFIIGAIFSVLAGYFGMQAATKANV